MVIFRCHLKTCGALTLTLEFLKSYGNAHDYYILFVIAIAFKGVKKNYPRCLCRFWRHKSPGVHIFKQ
jgi:hypothetical protein